MSENHQLVCSHCEGINRIPLQRLKDNPSCGKCKKNLTIGTPKELNDVNYIKFSTKNTLPIVIDFWAEWCGPCKMMAPAFSDAAKDLEGVAVLAKLNTETAQRTAAKFAIRSIPTMIIFKGGNEISRQSGVMTKEQIVQWLHSFI